jgi:hypothetical protein
MNLFITLLENVNKSRTSANNVSLKLRKKLSQQALKREVIKKLLAGIRWKLLPLSALKRDEFVLAEQK